MPNSVFASHNADTRAAWRGPSLLLLHDEGWIHPDGLTGYYFRETRFLSRLELRINDEPPFLCSMGAGEMHQLDLALIHPEVRSFGAGGSGLSGQEGERPEIAGLPVRSLDLRIRHRVRPASLRVTLHVANRADRPVDAEFAWLLDADFADLQEANAPEQRDQRSGGQGSRQQSAPVEVDAEADGVRFRYTHPRLPLESRITARGGGPWRWDGGRLGARLRLEPQEVRTLELEVRAVDPENPMDATDELRREEHMDAWMRGLARVEAGGEGVLASLFNRATREVGALALLEGGEREWMTPAAGLPLYPSLFGRDALVAGWQILMLDRGAVADAAMSRVAGLQGREHDPRRDEQPGRIVQQARSGPLARLDITPFSRYYADFASPFDFVNCLGQLYAWTGERECLERHWDAARRVMDWAREHGDRDGDGYLEYLTLSPDGPEHQGWKDSGGAIVYPDGRDVEPPLAVCEVQGYYYVALQTMAALHAVMGDLGAARHHWREATELKRRFNQDFWMEEEGFVALALDRDRRPVRTIASNPGQCLATGIVSSEHAPRVAQRLLEPDLFSGWGIRTLSTRNPAYNPLSYHLGSVWPVENGATVFGLRRYGFTEQSLRLTRALLDLSLLWPAFRIPECVGGYSRVELPHPGVYPRANAPQTWNQSVYAMLLQSMLSVIPAASLGLLFVDPALPDWMPELTVHDLRVGDARVTLRFHRDADGASHHEVVRQQGELRVLRQPSPDDLNVGIGTRLGLLIRDLIPL